MLASTDPFSFESISANPQQEPPSRVVNNIYYELLYNNNFLRIHTNPGRFYHHLQAHFCYQLPDWKLHFAIQPEDLSRAWNILAELFMEKNCLSTMKMIVPSYGTLTWPAFMHGREITIYIYQHKRYYENLNWAHLPTRETQQSREFWLSFLTEAERRLAQHNIRERPHPEGDKPLGRYASLRNEAYIIFNNAWDTIIPKDRRVDFNNNIYCYPPNETGYNAAGHKNPLDRKLYAFFAQSINKKVLRNAGKPQLAIIQQEIRMPAP
jgi:hypothetical protein